MVRVKHLLLIVVVGILFSCRSGEEVSDLPRPYHNLRFEKLPEVWDEALPLGNGLTGALIWQKEGKLRIAIDRADLWDLRPVEEFKSPDRSYQFICDQVLKKKDIAPIQRLIDDRTKYDAAPTKIPAGAIEFNIASLGKVKDVSLDLTSAVCTILWENGAKARIFVSANEKGGRFFFENLPDTLSPELITPLYEENDTELDYQPGVNKLTALGYKRGKVERINPGTLLYQQQGWGDVSYEIALKWKSPSGHSLEGEYCVTSKGTWYSEREGALECMRQTMSSDFNSSLAMHKHWWREYWMKSSISLPDTLLEKQWYLEMYKFAAASRKGAPPICLQAVWTADNGQTPPWRGDFHSDLNTQLSYWAGYTSNHLEESSVFTDWLWKIKENAEAFTRQFYGVEGLNVPCIATLTGEPIGGWSPYSHSPSTAGWLSHHFYLQWKYSMDTDFLKNRAYPWIKEVAQYFENISVRGENGERQLPLSTSPEINDNRIDAWFQKTTNYDLANIRLTYTIAREMAEALGLNEEAGYWVRQLSEWPKPAVNESGLMIAPGKAQTESHRHFSHLLSFHPFGLIDVSKGNGNIDLILRSIKNVEMLGTDWWTGYTYAWLANMKARVFEGDDVVRNLHIFIKAFCSPNSFHLNGDQLKAGYSQFTYRPFTLEGNFACAAAIQEMLLQSHTGVIKVFPALSTKWEDVSFRYLRAMGAFLVSASYEGGKIASITVESEKGGWMKLYNPFTDKITERKMVAGETITFTNKFPMGK